MDSDDLGNELVRLEGGFLVDEETYVVNSDDVLGKTKILLTTSFLTLDVFTYFKLVNCSRTRGEQFRFKLWQERASERTGQIPTYCQYCQNYEKSHS